ncbi:MAG: T9SS type A sorting domain-containing protein, partial [Spirosomaceae bacterium]|nr:T9SS type A sorting domain-containing protein [Spirosomataceae bacterium]
VPICLLNGSVGSKTLAELSQRNDSNHQDPSTLYGQFLIKAKFAKLASKAPILIWRQGEAEAVFGTDLSLYQRNFEKFWSNLKEDFGGLKKMYVLQNNILMLESTNASELRDFQRRTKSLYNDIETLATVGTAGYDGLHYHPEGYRQTGLELSRLIGRDFFWTTDGYEINSPDLKKAFYSANKDSVILIFDNNLIEMVYQSEINLMDGKKRYLKDFIYLDNDNRQILEGSSEQNRVILKLKSPSNAQKISYLPHFFIDWSTTYFYNGPFITNSIGMRAFTFGSFPIANALPKSSLILQSVQFTQKKLTLAWTNNNPAGTTYRIERSKNNLADFQQIGTTKNKTFEDNLNFEKGAVYYYRVIAEDAVSESPESNIIEVNVPKSASMIFPDGNSVDDPKFGVTLPQFLEKDLIIFPNPIEKGQSLTFFAKEDIGSLINLTDSNGKEFLRIEKNNADLIEIPTDNLKSGVYLMNIFKTDGTKASKRFIIK